MPNPPPTSADASKADALLDRALGTRQLAASIFNYTVGSGIFALPALAVAQLGTAAPFAYLACAALMTLVVLCLAEAGSRVSVTGGLYAYIEIAFGPFIGFIAGALLLVTGLSAGAAVATIFAGSVVRLLPGVPQWTQFAIIVAVIAIMVAINVRGVRSGARAMEAITVAKLLPLTGFALIGAFFVDPGNLEMEHVPPMSSILATAGVVIFAFSGIESALTPSGEVRTPARTVPRAAFIAIATATLLYLVIQWVALGLMGLSLGEQGAAPLAEAAATFGGPAARTILIAGAAISMLGYLSVNILSVPRSLFAFGRDGFIPNTFSTVHAQFRTPHVAIVVYGFAVVALALTGTFEQLAVLANMTALILYFLCAIAVLVLRRRDVRSDGPPFVIPGGPLIPIATCAGIVWLFYATVGRREWIGLGITVAVACALYFVRRLRTRSA